MRLTQAEKTGILLALQKELFQESATIHLYGSRTDDAQVGGDIDLLIEVPHAGAAAQINARLHILLSAIKTAIGDQRIDLSVKDSKTLRADPFWKQALSKSIELGHTG